MTVRQDVVEQLVALWVRFRRTVDETQLTDEERVELERRMWEVRR
jgi:hypothetical protein